jgi:hypothetical protein
MTHQNAADELRGNGEEVVMIRETSAALIHPLEVCLMDEGGGLEQATPNANVAGPTGAARYIRAA